MKKTKQGNLLKKKWGGRCQRCGSEFEAELSEIEHKVTHDQRDGSFVREKCPDCDHEFFLYQMKQGNFE
jgi:hypothetical protein